MVAVEAPPSTSGRNLALLGLLLQIAQVIGYGGALYTWTLATLARGAAALEGAKNEGLTGHAGPGLRPVSAYASQATVFTILYIVGVLGLFILAFALMKYRYRARWFFWVMAAYSAGLLFCFPVGTVFGFVFLNHLLLHQKEFGAKTTGEAND